MSHTKEPWELVEYDEYSEDEYEIISGKEMHVAICSKKNGVRIVSCVNACIGLTEPEKQIRDLVTHSRKVMELLGKHGEGIVPHLMDTDDNPGQRLRESLEPFKDYKGEG